MFSIAHRFVDLLRNKRSSSYMLSYDNTQLIVKEGVSVLEILEQAKFNIPYSCRAGVCHSCMMKTDDAIPAEAQQGLSASQVAQGYFLSCACYPKNDMQVSLKGVLDMAQGQVVQKKRLNDTVLALFIQVDFRWFPGQYLTVWKDAIEGRSYSIASRCNLDRVIELHIKRHDQGLLSQWLHDQVGVGDLLHLSQPIGDCFYTDEHADKPLLMACTGTGLAPLYGILLEALEKGHAAPIYIYTAAGEPKDLYYQTELNDLSTQYSNVHHVPVVRRYAEKGMVDTDIADLLKERHPQLHGWKVFLCGSPEMVKKVQRNCFFQGAAINDILVDAFEIKSKPEQ
jgi:CDP-4-dehydro-6-deoxyglucose reductase, E3